VDGWAGRRRGGQTTGLAGDRAVCGGAARRSSSSRRSPRSLQPLLAAGLGAPRRWQAVSGGSVWRWWCLAVRRRRRRRVSASRGGCGSGGAPGLGCWRGGSGEEAGQRRRLRVGGRREYRLSVTAGGGGFCPGWSEAVDCGWGGWWWWLVVGAAGGGSARRRGRSASSGSMKDKLLINSLTVVVSSAKHRRAGVAGVESR